MAPFLRNPWDPKGVCAEGAGSNNVVAPGSARFGVWGGCANGAGVDGVNNACGKARVGVGGGCANARGARQPAGGGLFRMRARVMTVFPRPISSARAPPLSGCGANGGAFCSWPASKRLFHHQLVLSGFQFLCSLL